MLSTFLDIYIIAIHSKHKGICSFQLLMHKLNDHAGLMLESFAACMGKVESLRLEVCAISWSFSIASRILFSLVAFWFKVGLCIRVEILLNELCIRVEIFLKHLFYLFIFC